MWNGEADMNNLLNPEIIKAAASKSTGDSVADVSDYRHRVVGPLSKGPDLGETDCVRSFIRRSLRIWGIGGAPAEPATDGDTRGVP